MQRVVCPLVTMLVLALMGRPALGQVQKMTPPAWADSLVGTWIGESDPEVIVLQSDSTVLMGGYRRMALDTMIWFRKDRWSFTRYQTRRDTVVGRDTVVAIVIRVGGEADEQDNEIYSGSVSVRKWRNSGLQGKRILSSYRFWR